MIAAISAYAASKTPVQKYWKIGYAGQPSYRKCDQLYPNYTPDEIEFMMAMDACKRRLGRHLNYRDILREAMSLGYRKAS